MAYFGLASVWGFVAGTAAFVIASSSSNRSVEFGQSLVLTLGLAAAISVIGGVVVSLAYREAVRRRGS